MTTPDKLVQAIAVVPGNHRDTIAATALAAAAAYQRTQTDPIWNDWFAHDMTKTVRRATKSAQIAKLTTDFLVASEFTIGDARAFAYRPMPYGSFPKHLTRLQVSGLEIADEASGRGIDDSALTIEINAQLEMSTGKTAAQVAHALVLWTRDADAETLTCFWRKPSLQLHYCDFDDQSAGPNDLVIHDNGLTEITPGSATVWIPHIIH